MSSTLPGYEEALALVRTRAGLLRTIRPAVENVGLQDASGRVLAEPVCADSDQPPFARSTRDGFACRGLEASRNQFLLLAGATRAGEPPAGPLPPGAAWEIMTGAPVPEGADAVMMVEHVELAGDKVRLSPQRQITSGENIVPQGAQARAGDELLARGSTLSFGQIALAATCGCASLDVFRKPRVAILTTGDELVAVNSVPGPGQIRNSNAPMLAALIEAAGGESIVLSTAADSAEALDASLTEAMQADLLLISGGVSAGKFDLVEPALARLGAQFHFTGVRIQPGKPLVFGELPRQPGEDGAGELKILPFFGLPGNPVSSAVTFLLFAVPVLSALAGNFDFSPRFALAQLGGDYRGKPGLTRFLPALCDFSAGTGNLPRVVLVPWQGSGDLAAQARSNCFLVVPEATDCLGAGAIVRILPH